MSELKPETVALGPTDPSDLDDVEIIEIVGLDEPDQPSVEPRKTLENKQEEPDEIVLEIDGDEAAVESDEKAKRLDQLMRLQADFDNYKNRVEKGREAERRQASADIVSRLLSVLDNFERAVSALRQNGDDAAFRDGVILIFKQILDELRKDGLIAIDTVGQTFDPSLHEAVATDSTSDFPPHTVVEELQRGYLLHERLLRPALVKVRVDPADLLGPSDGGEE